MQTTTLALMIVAFGLCLFHVWLYIKFSHIFCGKKKIIVEVEEGKEMI